MAALILWQVIQIVPVQLLAALQIAGFISHVTLLELAVVQIGVLAGTAAWFRMHKSSSSSQIESQTITRLPTYILACAAVLAGSYFLFALRGLSSFPSGSDALTYHLPLASRWLQDGSLNLPAFANWRFSLPGNAEIMMMVLLASGHQSAVVLVNCVAALVLALSAYRLAMAMSKGDKAASLTVCLIVLSIPMVEFQTFSAYVDMVGTAAICAAFALLLGAALAKEKRDSTVVQPAVLLISALGCGISLGTKPIFYFYSLMWAAVLCVILWQKRSHGAKAVLRSALLAGIGLILPSGFWFARAAIQTGNPLYPIQLRMGQDVNFRGVETSEITAPSYEENFVHQRRDWLIYPWTEWKRDPGYLMIPYAEGSGVGAAFAAFVPVGLAFFLWGILFRNPRDRVDLSALLFFGAGALAWWWFMQRMPRFGLPVAVFACVLSAPMLGALLAYRKRAFEVLVVISVSATCAISSFVPFHVLAGMIRTGRWERAQVYAYPKLIDNLPIGSRVLNASGLPEKNFPLEGMALTNHVIADFEAPSQLTPESLRATGADFIAEIVPSGRYSAASLVGAGARVIADDVIFSGEDRVHWRIWQVEKPPTAKNAP